MPAHHSPIKSERLAQLALAYAPTLIIRAAIQHRIFDILDKGAKTLEQLSQATGTQVRGLKILLNALISLNFLDKDPQERYALTPEGAAFLVSTKPNFYGGLFQHTSVQLLPRLVEQIGMIGTGNPIAGNPEAANRLQPLPPVPEAAALLTAQLNIAQSKSPLQVLDLAASLGAWGIAIARQSRQVCVTAIDWAGVIELTQQNADRAGLGDRFCYIEGNLLTVDFGSGYQLATLGYVLHGEGKIFSRKLLHRVFAALAPGGTIAIASDFCAASGAESMPHPVREPVSATLFAVDQLLSAEEAVFSPIEISSWLTAAGFIDVRTIEAADASALILAAKPL